MERLTPEALCEIIETHSDMIDVFIGSQGRCMLSGELETEVPVCMNGSVVQLNLEYVKLDELMDDPFIAKAFNGDMIEEAERLSKLNNQ